MNLEFTGGVWAAGLNLGVISMEMGLKFLRQNRMTGIWKDNCNRNGARCILRILIR